MMRESETISKEMSARQIGLPRWYGLRGWATWIFVAWSSSMSTRVCGVEME